MVPTVHVIPEGRHGCIAPRVKAPAPCKPSPKAKVTQPRHDPELPRPLDFVSRDRRAARTTVPPQQTIAVEDAAGAPLRGPIVERRTFADPADQGATYADGTPVPARQVSGYHRSSTLRQLRAGGTQITQRSLLAADLYETDFEASQRGGFPHGPPPEIRGSSGPGDYTALVYHGREFDEAKRFVGRFGSHLLNHVLFDRRDVGSWAATQMIEGRPLDRKAAMGVLIAVLERLAEHYQARIDTLLQSARRRAAAERAEARARERT